MDELHRQELEVLIRLKIASSGHKACHNSWKSQVITVPSAVSRCFINSPQNSKWKSLHT